MCSDEYMSDRHWTPQYGCIGLQKAVGNVLLFTDSGTIGMEYNSRLQR